MNQQDVMKMLKLIKEERIENADNLTIGSLLKHLDSSIKSKS